MADTYVTSNSRVQVWNSRYFSEYVRDNPFFEWMGENENKPIQIKMDLTKKAGEVIHIPLIGKLTGPGVTGNAQLEGNETSLSNYDASLTVDWRRKGVIITKKEQNVTEMDIRNAAKSSLKIWAMEQTRDDILQEYLSPVIGGGVKYKDATNDQMDAWAAANTDRVFYLGTTTAMASNADHSAGLVSIEDANVVTLAVLDEFKRLVKVASPRIRPIMTGKTGEWFVGVMPTQPFSTFRSALSTIHQNAAPRSMKDNPLFSDGDLVYNGVIWKECPEYDDIIAGTASGLNPLPTSGDSANDNDAVAPIHIIGAQALAIGYGQKGRLVVKPDQDYDFRWGVAHEECLKVQKLFYNSVQHGMATLFVSNA